MRAKRRKQGAGRVFIDLINDPEPKMMFQKGDRGR